MSNSNDEPPGCLGFFLRIFMGAPKPTPDKQQELNSDDIEALPYRTRDDFLSPAELSFYRVLSSVVGSRATICPKVGLSDILFVSRPNENRAHSNRIAQKHVDFLLCDPSTMKPLCGIELDDRSHSRSDREARDMFVDKAFEAAGLPLARYPVQAGYTVQDIDSRIAPYMASLSLASPPTLLNQDYQVECTVPRDTGTSPFVPTCPKCGVPMTLRKAGRGSRAGEEFYGCVNYPKCRQTSSSIP